MLCVSIVNAMADKLMMDDGLNQDLARYNASQILEEVYDETDDYTEMVGVF